MADLADGESVEVQGSGKLPYVLKNTGGVYACSCPAWRNQSTPIERRTCKHLRALRGDAAEELRLTEAAARAGVAAEEGGVLPERAKPTGAKETAPPLLLAHSWEGDVDLTDWWLSEKLDGVRAYWDGTSFISRLGNRFFAPPWFTQDLPNIPLDGELFGGRKKFQRTVGIVKRQDHSPLWKELQFLVFDAPAHGGPFEERVAHIEELLGGEKHPYARPHSHRRCTGEADLRAELDRVDTLGGEGLMLRKPKSRYEAGRSTTLLKVKRFYDAEATVVDYVAGAGRHKGRIGALLVELPDGTRFSVGTGLSDAERNTPPARGAVITFRYQELSDGGVPRFPSYIGERIDHDPTVASPLRGAASTERAIVDPGRKPVAVSAPAPVAVAAPAPVTAPAPASGSNPKRLFEFRDATSQKFWEVTRTGAALKIRYGKIGSGGQTTLKEFASDAQAEAEAAKLVREKISKGYVEVL